MLEVFFFKKVAKVKQVMNIVKQYHPILVFLQKTYLLSSETGCLKKRWPGQVITCSFSSYARGIVVLVHKSVPLRIQRQDRFGSRGLRY